MSYDFVIVGAGSAGCVLAARLTERADVSVLLLESGGAHVDDTVRVPILFSQQFKSPRDWDSDSEPDPGRDGRRTYLPRGRGLGGCSSINTQIYIRGSRADYDAWARLTGDPVWSWDAVQPYFLRSEDHEGGANNHHGVGGPLRVSRRRSDAPTPVAWVESAVAAGMVLNEDFNGDTQDGVGFYAVTQRNGVRESTATSFLDPVQGRPNLTVLTGAHALRVLHDGARANGVRYEHRRQLMDPRAERSVVLCAGTYQSPQLLLLSGIGPPAELAALGIDPAVDLPVGRNLLDHFAVPLTWLTHAPSLPGLLTPEAFTRWENTGTGPFASTAAEAGGFLRTHPDLDAPDIQLHMGPGMSIDEGLGVVDRAAWSVGVSLLTPTSRGTVTLRVPDARVAPRIRHDYLATHDDRRRLAHGVRVARRIADFGPIREMTTRPHRLPESDAFDDIARFAARRGASLYHPVGTCAMGSVVDSHLQVLGLEALHVVDASIMPTIPRGNTNAPVMMIAERAAELLI